MSSAIPIQNTSNEGQIPVQLPRSSFAHTPGMGGISWGGASVGSWLRDEVLMASKGNKEHASNDLLFASESDDKASNLASNLEANSHASASNSTSTLGGTSHTHSADHDAHDPLLDLAPTYFPSLEASFCKDYTCCGRMLPTLHDLLRHYEEQHIQLSPQEEPPVMRRMQNIETVSTNDVFLPFNQPTDTKDDDMMGLDSMGDGFPGIDDMDMDLGHGAHPHPGTGASNGLGGSNSGSGNTAGSANANSNAGGTGASGAGGASAGGASGSASINSTGSHLANGRAFAPPSFQPLTTNTLQQYNSANQMRAKPVPMNANIRNANSGSTMLGRIGNQPGMNGGAPPGHLNGASNSANFSNSFGYNNLNAHHVGGVLGSTDAPGASRLGTGTGLAFGDDEEPTIDDPARQLYMLERSENKPFKCPVIGCEKTYKNQNGLKYHRQHGHQNQTLHLNDDGTYSIIDPLSNTPYPDGMGMEKDKPYRCEICGKRYKNLNGLKYHRAHSTH